MYLCLFQVLKGQKELIHCLSEPGTSLSMLSFFIYKGCYLVVSHGTSAPSVSSYLHILLFFTHFLCRAVAQYLKSQSPKDLSSDLNLNKILEGKRRKLCARMFFETLVIFLDISVKLLF